MGRMKVFALGLLLSTTALAQNYAGTWSFTARGSDGTVLQQSVAVQQTTREGKTYLSGGGFTALVQNGGVSYATTRKDTDATRTYTVNLAFGARTATGNGTVREVYKNGEVLVTRFTISEVGS